MTKCMTVAASLFLALYGCASEDQQPLTLASIGPGAVVLYGDSRVAQAPFTQLCDRPVFNAGVSGVTTAQMIQRIKWDELRRYPPFVIIVSVGVNDLFTGQVTPVESMVGSLAQSVTDIEALGVRVILSTVAPVEPFDRGLWVDVAALDDMNQRLRQWGQETQHTVLDFNEIVEKGFTTDGIHYTQAFYGVVHHWYSGHVCQQPKGGGHEEDSH